MFWTILAWIALALLSVLLVVLGYLLFARIRLQLALGLENASGEALPEHLRLSVGPLLVAELLADETVLLRWRLLFWTGRWRPMDEPFPEAWAKRLGTSEKNTAPKPERKRKNKNPSWRPSPARILAMLQELPAAVHVAHCRADIDTGNWVLNAKLYPVAAWWQSRGGTMQFNFQGRTTVELDVWTRAVKLLWVLLLGLLKPKPDVPTAASFYRSLGPWLARNLGAPAHRSQSLVFAGTANSA